MTSALNEFIVVYNRVKIIRFTFIYLRFKKMYYDEELNPDALDVTLLQTAIQDSNNIITGSGS